MIGVTINAQDLISKSNFLDFFEYFKLRLADVFIYKFFISWLTEVSKALHDSDDPGYIELEKCNEVFKPCRKYCFYYSFLSFENE